MLQRRAISRRLNPSLPATQLVGADLMNPLGGDIFPVAPAITDIDVVGVTTELPPLPEVIQPADMGPKGCVDFAIAAPVDSVDAAPGMAPAPDHAAPTLTPAEEITATLPAMADDVESKVQVATEIITAAPTIVAIAHADTVTTDAIPATPKKTKKPRRKPENEGLGDSAGKTRKPRRKSAMESGTSGKLDLTLSEGRSPGYDLGGTSGAHSPP
jgi:hypothetical protein